MPDGSLQLIDGHLRAEESGDRPIPVLVLDVTEAEADKLLAAIDPLAALAGVDAARLDDLLAGAGQMPPALESWLAIQSEGAHAASLSPSSDAGGDSDSPALTYAPSQVVKLVLLAPDVAAVERALAATGEVNRGEALKLICESYLREARQQNV